MDLILNDNHPKQIKRKPKFEFTNNTSVFTLKLFQEDSNEYFQILTIKELDCSSSSLMCIICYDINNLQNI